MAAVISLRNSYIAIRDNGTNAILVKVGDGNLTYDKKRAIEYILNRGQIGVANGGGVRQGNDIPTDVSFQFMWEWIKTQTGVVITVEDALCKLNAASEWVSTGDPCEPYAVNIEVAHVGGCTGTTQDETITLKEFRWESISHDLKAGTCSVSGKCNVPEPVITRGTYTAPTEAVGA